jgi:6-phosphogluconolactonase
MFSGAISKDWESFLMRIMRWIAVGVMSMAVATRVEGQKAPACGDKSDKSLLVYIGTYGHVRNGFSPVPAGSENQPGQIFDKTQGIYAACFNTETGNLTMLGLAADVNRASWLLSNPNLPILYSTGLPGDDLRVEGNVFSFSIDRASGKLQLINQVGSGGGDPTHLAIDAESYTLFVANHDGGKVTALPIRQDGGLEPVVSSQTENGTGPSPRQAGPHPHGVVVDPTHRYILAADFGADRIFIYHLDPATKTLSPASPLSEHVPPGSAPRHLVFHPNGQFVFLDTELSAELRSYKWDAVNGDLQLVQTAPLYPPTYSGTKSAADLAVSRDGRFLYQSLRGDQDSIIVFKVDQKHGTLTELQRISSQGKTPWDFVIDPTGHWVLVANVASNSVAVLKINPATGTLTATDHTLSMLQPNAITFIPNR